MNKPNSLYSAGHVKNYAHPNEGWPESDGQAKEETPKRTISWKRFRYTMKDKTLSRTLVE